MEATAKCKRTERKQVKGICLPRMGIYSDLISRLAARHLKWESNLAPNITDRNIELGAGYMNELVCLPAKVVLGGFIEACNNGARHMIMFDSCGSCRLKAYWVLHERILKKMGYNIVVHPVRLGWRTPGDLRAIDPSIARWRAWWLFVKFLKEIRDFDEAYCTEISETSNFPRIGIVGEIYTMLEPMVNRHLVMKLRNLGAYVHISLSLSYFVFKRLYERGWMRRKDMDSKLLEVATRKAHRYFPKNIGGHGNESIINTIYYALNGFDGVIHVLPFPCMPESTVASVLDDISHEYGIPLMRLIYDTHTGEIGLNTRLEAFVDVLARRKKHVASSAIA